ncbi:MAG: hypothetical protein U0271_39460 [Polyangiaceae bacterium]
MPSGSTSAIPEWLPPRVTIGTPATARQPEPQLVDTRQLTEGWAVTQIVWSGEPGAPSSELVVPQRRALLIVGQRPGDAEPAGLYALDLSDGAIRKLSREGDSVSGVAELADGSILYAARARAGGRVNLQIGTDGVPRPVAPTVDAHAVARGADGALFVTEGAEKDAFQLARHANLDDRKGTVLASGDVSPIPPAVSTSGDYVVFGRGGDCGSADHPRCSAAQLLMASREGRGARVLFDRAHVHAAAFHPSGRTLLFASDLDRAAFELYALDPLASSEAPRRVTFDQGDCPALSSDGRFLAFTSTRGGGSHDVFVATFIEDP